MGSGKRHFDWLRQAEDDLSWGKDSLSAGHFAQSCFIAQQVAEKSLKAIAYKRGSDLVKSHSVVEICKSLEINDELLEAGKRLDQYYISTRYPDAMPTGAPFEFFTDSQGKEALDLAEKFIVAAGKEIRHE